MKLMFTEQQSIAANRAWGANCGPHTIAAALALDLETVRALMPDFERKGYTNPTMVSRTLDRAGITYSLTKGLLADWLCEGINRVQWTGPWLKPGVPAAAAYWKTHLIAAAAGMVFCTCVDHRRWVPVDVWRASLPTICAEIPRCDGWHITHHWGFDVLAKEAA